ncbi:hypothetical protein ACU686_28110 [Yinghuangia aomiensis]
MPHLRRPAPGSWTEKYPELGTGPVDYTDSVDPEFYAAEGRRSSSGPGWASAASTSRASAATSARNSPPRTSLVIVRGKDDKVADLSSIRVPQHVRHRGNKLVWNDFPGEGSPAPAGSSPASTTRGATASKGEPAFIQQEGDLTGVGGEDYGLPRRSPATYGRRFFVFVNLDPRRGAHRVPRRDGHRARGLRLHEMTEVYTYKAEIGSNWKLFIDAFAVLPAPCCTRSRR